MKPFLVGFNLKILTTTCYKNSLFVVNNYLLLVRFSSFILTCLELLKENVIFTSFYQVELKVSLTFLF